MPDTTTPRKPRSLVETLKINATERTEIKQAARKLKIPRSQFIRDAALAAARGLKAA